MMEELKSEKQFFYSLDELGSVVTSAMESSVAAAEFRALSFVDLDNWDVNDLRIILDAKNILVSIYIINSGNWRPKFISF